MKNIHLSAGTLADIDKRVARMLQDLGNPTPPIKLPEVRELLRLDIEYYSTNDPTLLQEFIHKLNVAGKQLLLRPTLIFDVVKEFSLKALFLPDRKRILLDSSIPDAKQRWNEGHEIVHSMLPWHNELMLGDTSLTLSPACHDQIEAEANFGNGRMLFLRDQFDGMCKDVPSSIASVRTLKEHFGNTMTSTLWRFVEQSPHQIFGVVCDSPHKPGPGFDPKSPIRHFITSPKFEQQFSGVSEQQIFSLIRSYASRSRGGPLGKAEVVLKDVNGVDHLFAMESFSNTYDVLTLGVWLKVRPIVG